MPIQVICPGCHARFKVSDKFAGKKGPCPKCKKVIQVPDKSDEVRIETPEDAPPGKTATGAGSLKPIKAKETKFNPLIMGGIAGGTLLLFVVALLLGFAFDPPEEPVPTLLLAIGAIALAPPLTYAAYFFLVDNESEGFIGVALWTRVAICAAVYAVLWGVIAFLLPLWGLQDGLELYHYFFILPGLLCTGAIAGFACFDLDYGSAVVHYALYLGVTILLRLTMGMAVLG